MARAGGGWIVPGLDLKDRSGVWSAIGIDILKDTPDAHRLSIGEPAEFPNSPVGLHALRRRIGAAMPDLVVFEATGACHAPLSAAVQAFCRS